MAVQSRVAAVTGANKGIGLAIVRNLALEYPKSPLRSGPLLIYLTARSAERGAEAVETLNNDPQLQKAKALAQDGGETTIKFQTLDISNTDSIHEFASFLKQEHPDGIDILINNAGIAMDGFNNEVVNNTLHTNYYGTLEITQLLVPHIRRDGRLVNVSSMSGKLNKYPLELRAAFISASKTSPAACTSLMEAFKSAVAEGNEKEKGWPSAAYAVSKAGCTAMTKAIAFGEAKKGSGVLVNACCPGYVNTDMTKGGGVKTPDEGARTPVMLALADISEQAGGFWQNEKMIECKDLNKVQRDWIRVISYGIRLDGLQDSFELSYTNHLLGWTLEGEGSDPIVNQKKTAQLQKEATDKGRVHRLGKAPIGGAVRVKACLM